MTAATREPAQASADARAHGLECDSHAARATRQRTPNPACDSLELGPACVRSHGDQLVAERVAEQGCRARAKTVGVQPETLLQPGPVVLARLDDAVARESLEHADCSLAPRTRHAHARVLAARLQHDVGVCVQHSPDAVLAAEVERQDAAWMLVVEDVETQEARLGGAPDDEPARLPADSPHDLLRAVGGRSLDGEIHVVARLVGQPRIPPEHAIAHAFLFEGREERPQQARERRRQIHGGPMISSSSPGWPGSTP